MFQRGVQRVSAARQSHRLTGVVSAMSRSCKGSLFFSKSVIHHGVVRHATCGEHNFSRRFVSRDTQALEDILLI
jgi:hypothetical protein